MLEKKLRTLLRSAAVVAALGATGACATFPVKGADTVTEVRSLSDDRPLTQAPEPPQYLTGNDPFTVAHNRAERERYECEKKHLDMVYRAHEEKKQIPVRNCSVDAKVSEDDVKAYERTVLLLKKEETVQSLAGVEKAREERKAEEEKTKQLGALGNKQNVAYGHTNNPPGQQQVINNITPGGYGIVPAGEWVKQIYGGNNLALDVQKAICNGGSPAGYASESLGTITFEDCDMKRPIAESSQGLQGLLEKVTAYAPQGKLQGTLLVCGNASAPAADGCPSGNNTDLSGHRAVSVLNAIYGKVGEQSLQSTHADVYSNGEKLDARTVLVYLVNLVKTTGQPPAVSMR